MGIITDVMFLYAYPSVSTEDQQSVERFFYNSAGYNELDIEINKKLIPSIFKAITKLDMWAIDPRIIIKLRRHVNDEIENNNEPVDYDKYTLEYINENIIIGIFELQSGFLAFMPEKMKELRLKNLIISLNSK
jgi:hypothetical protein